MNLFLKQIALILVYTILFNYSNISLSKDKIDTSFKNIIIHQKSKDFPTLYLKNVKGEDIIGRDDNFNKVPLDSSFPAYLIENIKKYKDWIDE